MKQQKARSAAGRVFIFGSASFARTAPWQWVLGLLLQQFSNFLNIGASFGGGDLMSYIKTYTSSCVIWISLGAMVLAASSGILRRDDAARCIATGSRRRFAAGATLAALLTAIVYVLLLGLLLRAVGMLMLKKTYTPENLDKTLTTMGLTALYLFCLMQLCLDINLACQFPFGCVAGAVLLCLLFSPLVSLRQLFGIEGFSLIEILDGENAQQSAIIMGVIAIVLAAASQLAVKMADMLARSREGSAE